MPSAPGAPLSVPEEALAQPILGKGSKRKLGERDPAGKQASGADSLLLRSLNRRPLRCRPSLPDASTSIVAVTSASVPKQLIWSASPNLFCAV